MTVLRSPLYSPLVGKYGNAALALLRGKQGFAVSFIDDAVAVQDNATPSNNFVGSMAQAVDRGILVNASPPTKWLLNSSGILTSGSNLRCQYSAAGVPLGFLPEPQRTNLLLNSAVLATQSVTVSATAYTLSFEGTGTVTLSGASTAGPLVGTGATDRVPLTFTPSAGSLTLTVSGTVNYANLEAGLFPTSPIVTAGSQVTRAGTVDRDDDEERQRLEETYGRALAKIEHVKTLTQVLGHETVPLPQTIRGVDTLPPPKTGKRAAPRPPAPEPDPEPIGEAEFA